MIPNQNLNKGMSIQDSLKSSRAYTFIDSYVYMKNRSYNELYEKNKERMLQEYEAIKTSSPKLLYNAFFEQMRILDSVVVRVRDFVQLIQSDVESNIAKIMPDKEILDRYTDALNKSILIPDFKYISYLMKPIEYFSMQGFVTKYKKEIKEFCDQKLGTGSHGILRSHATDLLITAVKEYTNYSDSLLELEKVDIITYPVLVGIKIFFQRKQQIRNMLNRDFKTFRKFLIYFKLLDKMTKMLEPTIVGNQILIDIDGSKRLLTFNDYLILYKHFSTMSKYMLDMINYYNSKFFNKIYALQSNISIYKSIMLDVIRYTENLDIEYNINEWATTNTFNDLSDDINGNSAAAAFMNDEANDDSLNYQPDIIEGEDNPEENNPDTDTVINQEGE